MLGIPIGTLDQLMWAFCGVLGAIVGSFLNVCIYRIPIEGLQVSSPRGSFCPSCKSAVRWFDNIPVFAWLWLRGRCRDCSNPISPRYPLVEALTAALFLLAACRFGGDVFASEQLSTGVFDLSAMLFLVAMWTWISVLIVVSGIDFDHKIIPDRLSIPATCLVLLLSPWNSSLSVAVTATETSFLETVGGIWALAMSVLAGTVIVGGGFQRWIPNWEGQRRDSGESSLAYCIGALVGVLAAGYMVDSSSLVPESLSLTRIWTALMGAGVGAGLIYGIGKIGSIIFRKPAMGFGDVKWMGLLGATLGPLPTLFAFLLACLLGSVVGIWIRIRRGSSYIPFGPFLSAGALSMLLARPELQMLWDSYLSLLQG
jgi:leader peptidase (prepilin peptidase)/N-methyltransferase